VTKEIFEYEIGKAKTFAYLGERICYWKATSGASAEHTTGRFSALRKSTSDG